MASLRALPQASLEVAALPASRRVHPPRPCHGPSEVPRLALSGSVSEARATHKESRRRPSQSAWTQGIDTADFDSKCGQPQLSGMSQSLLKGLLEGLVQGPPHC